MAKVCIVLLTYNRFDYAARTLRTTLDNVWFSGELSVHIADDGSSPQYRQALKELAGGYPHVKSVCVTNSERGGYGKNYNLAMQVVHAFADYVLPLEDDWELRRPLNLDTFTRAFELPEVGCVRMGYIGYTQPLRNSWLSHAGNFWLLLDPASEEPHVFAGHPRLETVAWERKVGPWPESLLPGQTEFQVAHRPDARQGVVWPVSLVNPLGDLFAHIGTERSY